MNVMKEKIVEFSRKKKFMRNFRIFMLVYCILMLVCALLSFKGIIVDAFFTVGLLAFLSYDFMFKLEQSGENLQEGISIKRIILGDKKYLFEVFLILLVIVYLVLFDVSKINVGILTAILVIGILVAWWTSLAISKRFKSN